MHNYFELALGGAQFGMDYGVTNKVGTLTSDQVEELITKFIECGHKWIDTAPAYVDSESLIGDVTSGIERKISTKTVTVGVDETSDIKIMKLENGLAKSLSRLGERGIDILYLHQEELLNEEPIMAWLKTVKSRGKAKEIGASIYNYDALMENTDALKSLDWIQAPVNLFDQRILQDNTLSKLNHYGVKVQARSIFLQGILLNFKDSTIKIPDAIFEKLKRLHHDSLNSNFTVYEIIINFIKIIGVDSAVIGVTSMEELMQLHEAWAKPCFEYPYDKYACNNNPWILPTSWVKKK